MEQTNKQFDIYLIDLYVMLKRIRENALKENAAETVKAIEHEMNVVELKLRPTRLPDWLHI